MLCAEAAEQRCECYRQARRDALHPGLLKIIARERRFDAEMLDELAQYREIVASWAATPLAAAARASHPKTEELV
jgi:hypothetical protein